MKKNTLISVCIPVYNGETYIKVAIKSVLNQLITDLELIVVDDASTDNTAKIVNEIGDRRITYFKNEKNLGMVKNWNRCLELAHGKYIKLLMADDVLTPNSLIKQVKILENNNGVGLCYGYVRLIDENGKYINNQTWNDNTYKLADNNFLCPGFECIKKYLRESWLVGLPSAALVRKKVFDELGKFDIDGLDQEMWARICTKYDFYYLSDLVVKWRIRKSGTFTSMNTEIKNVGRDFRRLQKMAIYRKFIRDKSFLKEFNQLLYTARMGNLKRSFKLFKSNLIKLKFNNIKQLLKYFLIGGNLDKAFS